MANKVTIPTNFEYDSLSLVPDAPNIVAFNVQNPNSSKDEISIEELGNNHKNKLMSFLTCCSLYRFSSLISSRYQIIYNADFFGFIYFLHIVTLPFVTAVTLSFYFSVIVIKQFQDGFGHLLLSVVFGEETPQILYLKTDMLGLIGFFL